MKKTYPQTLKTMQALSDQLFKEGAAGDVSVVICLMKGTDYDSFQTAGRSSVPLLMMTILDMSSRLGLGEKEVESIHATIMNHLTHGAQEAASDGDALFQEAGENSGIAADGIYRSADGGPDEPASPQGGSDGDRGDGGGHPQGSVEILEPITDPVSGRDGVLADDLVSDKRVENQRVGKGEENA